MNTTATYTAQPDGTIKVVNAGRYFTKDGPLSTITGSAVALDSTNSRLNVSFAGPPSRTGPGNYWIVDLDPDYQWVIVSDPAGAAPTEALRRTVPTLTTRISHSAGQAPNPPPGYISASTPRPDDR